MGRNRRKPRGAAAQHASAGMTATHNADHIERRYYELFKACRLCGSGGGYKMPIVHESSERMDAEPELRHKIRDCCSIDVHPDDKMPPLICELCVDKVNDFYEFREMCRSTNSRVRASLGLPAQTLNQEMSEDCILGVSGPVIYNSKEYEMPQPIPQKPIKMKIPLKEKKEAKAVALSQSSAEKRAKKESSKYGGTSLLAERSTSKRKRGGDVASPAAPTKKIRFSDLPSNSSKNADRQSVNTSESTKKSKDQVTKKSTPANVCPVCNASFSKPVTLRQHLLTQHTPNILPEKLGCAPCREWFVSTKLAEEHHKWHRVSSVFYKCDRCSAEFKVLLGYTRHLTLKQCIPEEEIPDVVCSVCQKSFITTNLMSRHKCSGPPFTGANCNKCKKFFTKKAQLSRHENKCKGTCASPEVNPNNPHLKSLRSVQVSMLKCDTLLERIKKEPVDDTGDQPVYNVSGLGDQIVVKSEPFEYGFNESNNFDMDIKQEIKEEYPDYTLECDDNGFGDNFTSDDSYSDTETSHGPNLVINPFARKNNTQVESLCVISLRSIFSNKMFRKRTRSKKRIPKIEKLDVNSAFDTLLDNSNNKSSLTDEMREKESTGSNSSRDIVNIVNKTIGEEDGENSEVLNHQKDSLSSNLNVIGGSCHQYMETDETALCNISMAEDVNMVNIEHTNEVENTNAVDQIMVTAVEGSYNFMDSENHISHGECDKIADDQEKITNEEHSEIRDVFVSDEDRQGNQENTTNMEHSLSDNAFVSPPISQNDKISEEHTLNVNLSEINSISSINESKSETEPGINRENLVSIELPETDNVLNTEPQTDEAVDKAVDKIKNISEELNDKITLHPKNLSNLKHSEINDESIDSRNKELSDEIKNVEMVDSLNTAVTVSNNSENISRISNEDFSSDSLSNQALNEENLKKSFNEEKSSDTNVKNSGEMCDYVNENSLTNLITKSSDNADIDFDIDCMFQGELGRLAAKKQNEILENKKNDISVMINDVNVNIRNNIDSKDDTIAEIIDSLNEDEVKSDACDATLDVIQDSIKENFADLSSEQEIAGDKAENDVLDLVSDSGDDCNIIDSPEKLKTLDDQLLTDDNEDSINQVSQISTICEQNNDDRQVRDAIQFPIFPEVQDKPIRSDKIDLECALLDSGQSKSKEEKNNASGDFPSEVEIDKSILTSEEKSRVNMGIDGINDDININKLTNVSESDNSQDVHVNN